MAIICIQKSIINRPDYLGEKFSRASAWIDLLLLADDNGDLTFTFSSLAERWKWQRRAVRSYLDHLCAICAITYTMHNSGCSSEHNLTICNYDSYTISCTDKNTDERTVQKGSPSIPSLSSPNPPAPPYTPSITPPISPSKNTNKQVQDAGANAHEQSPYPPTPFPYPTPFILSSMEREACRQGQISEVAIKRKHLAENLRSIADSIGMSVEEQTRFLDFYCQAGDRNPNEILAERSGYFDLRYRATKWMENNKPKTEQQPKSRIERYAEKSQQLTQFINELYADSPNAGAATGPAVPPDEQ